MRTGFRVSSIPVIVQTLQDQQRGVTTEGRRVNRYVLTMAEELIAEKAGLLDLLRHAIVLVDDVNAGRITFSDDDILDQYRCAFEAAIEEAA